MSWFFLQSSMAELQPAARNEKVETWFDHQPGPSQYGIVWKSHPI